MPVDDLGFESGAGAAGLHDSMGDAGDAAGFDGATSEDSDRAGETAEHEATGADEAEDAARAGEPNGDEAKSAETAQQADGRAMPDDIKKSLKALQAVNPTAAGKLRDTFFEAKAFRDVFPTTAEAVKAKELIETVGGEDGVKGLQESLDQWAAIDRAYTEGSPELIKGIAENNPEAFGRMVPNALNHWATSNPEAYGYFSNSVALNTIAQLGLSPQNLSSLYAQVGENPQAQQIIRDVYGIVTRLEAKAKEFHQTQAQRNPQQERLERQKQEFEQARQTEFEKGINGQADSYVVEKSQPFLDQYLGGQAVTPEMRALIAEKVKAEVGQRLAKVSGFDQQIGRLYKARDGAQVIPYVQRNVDKILQPAVKAVVERLYRNVAPAKATQTGPQAGPAGVQAQRSTGVVELKSAPDWSRIDRSKTPDTDYLMGKAVLKDGRRVVWG